MWWCEKFGEFGNSCFIDQRWLFLKIIPSYHLRNPAEKKKNQNIYYFIHSVCARHSSDRYIIEEIKTLVTCMPVERKIQIDNWVY